MHNEEEAALEVHNDEPGSTVRKFLERFRTEPDAVMAEVEQRYKEAGERKARNIFYTHALVQQRLASQREKRQRSQLPEVPVTVDEDYWTSLLAIEPVDER